MIINGEPIGKGEEKVIDVGIAKLPSRSSVDISIVVSRGIKDGPVLLLMGGMHGDEINGVEIVKRVISQKIHQVEKGTVICIPLLNIYGFINFTREVPDGKDINRSFPGNQNGSLAARMAYYLMNDIIPKIDCGIDFHTGGAFRSNYPQIRCHSKGGGNNILADKFNAPFTVHSTYRPKSMRHSAANLGKEILVYEGGETLRFDELAIQQAIDGTQRVMKYLGMTKFAPDARHTNRIIVGSSWIRAKYSGIHNSFVPYGENVKKGMVVGEISNTLGQRIHTIKSPTDGYVIGLNNSPVVHQGDALFHIGKTTER
ncbi:MAG: succinylglutamate desuccinylase/aspartoacylase family protein [Cyclobacteriaceae bacterium]|nr:succinylglutamate desuccinylase/aspartoacylase family protein [Cyclobacteriaceae bacterium]